jgi:ribosome-binding factor A
MSSVRLEKICALIKKELSVIFQRNMQVMFDGIMITVTSVRVAPDLSMTKVFLSFFPAGSSKKGIELVDDQKNRIRKLLGDQTASQLRRIPELVFYVDDSLDYSDEIERLLGKKKP